MALGQHSTWQRMLRAGSGLLAGTACVLGLSSAVAAVSGGMIDAGRTIAGVDVAADGVLGAFTPASVDPKLIASLRRASSATDRAASEVGQRLFRFTPAGAQGAPRSVTVAVRVNRDMARSIAGRSSVSEGGRGIAGVDPVAFNLGVARGYQSFAQSSAALPEAGKRLGAVTDDGLDGSAPDLRTFTPAKSASGKSRFSPTVAFDGVSSQAGLPRAGGQGDVSVDVGGAYRVADNLKVTAGIRYSSERDRLTDAVDGQQDSQAVYVGTRFRF